MQTELRDGRLYLLREKSERDPLLARLNRIEGQVRGLHQMVEADRYCGDELTLATAILAAMREMMRMLTAQHIEAGLARMAGNAGEKDDIMADIAAVLRPLLREQ